MGSKEVRNGGLSAWQRAGLLRVGDVLIPGDGDLPSFSASGADRHIDRMLPYMYEADRRGALAALTLLRPMPRPLIRALLALTDHHQRFPGPLGAALRMLGIGVKGIVYSVYYSGAEPRARVHEVLGWDAVVRRRQDPESKLVPPAPPPQPLIPPQASDAERAVRQARAGQASLRRLTMKERLRLLGELRRVVLRRREEIVDRIQQDTRKSRSDALISEIFGVLDNLAWLEKNTARALADEKVPTPLALMGKKSRLWYEPLGTILIIAPWNYPFYQAIVPIACAFAAGNTVVFKPSEHTPLRGLVEDLLQEAGFAPAWVQVVYGDGRVGAELIAQRPDKIFFTGSTRTGRRVLAAAAEHLIPVELELGGKDAAIVFDDVHPRRAAAGVAWGALTTTGQSCTSVERIYVQRSIYTAFRDELVREVQTIRQGIDRDGGSEIGEMTTDFQVEIVARHVRDAVERGARMLTGGDWDGTSRRIPPIVLDGVTDDMLVAREETFGPVLPLLVFDSEDEVIRRANDSPYGLTASVWSHDLRRAERVASALAVGGVSINNVMATEANPALPFGGVRQSGFGRYKGIHGLRAFCNVKSVLIDRDADKVEANWYPYTPEKYRLFDRLTAALFSDRWLDRLRFVRAGLALERYADRAHREARGKGTGNRG